MSEINTKVECEKCGNKFHIPQYLIIQTLQKENAKLRELCRELLPSHGAICETSNSLCQRCNIEKTLKELEGVKGE